MTTTNDKRSSTTRINTIATTSPGVGARHNNPHQPAGGGGYLNICTPQGFSEKNFKNPEEQRINELKEIGLSKKWIQIAEAIGFDAFMAMWAILDSDNISNSGTACERVRMWIPTFKRYLRYQRNRYIYARAADNDAQPTQIKKEISSLLGEQLSLAHIKRIMDKVNITE